LNKYWHLKHLGINYNLTHVVLAPSYQSEGKSRDPSISTQIRIAIKSTATAVLINSTF
jgi:ABC-type branched-subunit amino acid transport system substrate-binding protein